VPLNFRLLQHIAPWAVLLGITVATGAQAGEWDIRPSLSLSESYTDNVQLVETGEEGDFITSITPGIAIRGEGRRLQMNADYLYNYNKYFDKSEFDAGTHNLQGNIDNELVRDHLFLDVNAAMFPAQVSNQGQVSNRNRNRRDRLDQLNAGNRADVISYGFTPRYQQALGSIADFTASNNYSDTSTGEGVAGGGKNNTLNMALNSGRRFARADWGLTFQRRDNQNDNTDEDQTFQELWANSGYQLNRLFKFTGRVGIEDNQFSTNQNQEGGPSWMLGGVLTPNPRTTLSGQFGQRRFGDTKQFDFNYRRRRVTISGNYNEELRTSNEVLRDQQVFRREDPFGNPLPINPIDNPDFGLPLDEVGLTDDVFINRRLDAVIGYVRKRDTFSANVYRNEQESTSNQQADVNTGFGASWNRRLSPRTSVGLMGDYQERESDGQQGSSTFLYLSPYLSYSIGPHLSSRLAYSYSDSTGDAADNSFTENTVTGSLSYAF
jgi:uncharacterized protein (PEP-CTERM system associated)